MEGRNETLVDNVMNRSLRSSHNQVRSNVQLEEQPIAKKMKSKANCPAMALDAFLHIEGVEVEREEEDDFESIGEDARAAEKEPANLTNSKNSLKHPAMTLDAFLGDQGIHVKREEEHIEVLSTKDARSRPSPNNRENVHIPYEEDYVGKHESDNFDMEGDQVMEEAHVTGDSKFILPKSSNLWVMTGVQGGWKRYKTRIKKKHFEPYSRNIEDMLVNRLLEIPEIQFQKLIAYWSIPTIKAMCAINSENRKKQQWRHKMGPIKFARVRVDLHEKKENKEEPNQAEMFVATRNGLKGKTLDVDTQAVIYLLYGCFMVVMVAVLWLSLTAILWLSWLLFYGCFMAAL
ncbi:uncharacterized protein LOC130934344 [Arachis stenosperma]|uniref:uncharacterized protein LOC130934344 n=1 Tax=Arachis stenosperma TaxID=217475 RepID=UPI0025AC791D|nr:uncharacterized protein LOC130934344 [Arachis stenosperma]